MCKASSCGVEACMLCLELADELWDTLYGYTSEPMLYELGRKVAVRVVSQFSEESSKVLTME